MAEGAAEAAGAILGSLALLLAAEKIEQLPARIWTNMDNPVHKSGFLSSSIAIKLRGSVPGTDDVAHVARSETKNSDLWT